MRLLTRKDFLKVSGAGLGSLGLTYMLTGCGSSSSSSSSEASSSSEETTSSSSETATAETTTPDPVTIKFLHKGPKPDGWDAVYEEYLNRTRDTLNIDLDITWVEHSDYKEKLNLEITSGGDWDLVFDASWIQLKNLAPEGYYADLSEYFNNDDYPGLKSAFSEDVMEANTWFGSMCYIPLFETYGNGVPVVWYRKDLAKEWGVGTDGQINSYDELEEFWQCALDNGMVAYGASQARGFFQMMTIAGASYEGAAQAGIQSVTAGGLTFWVYSEDGEVIDIAVQGAGDEAFANFPEGWNYDFGVTRYETFAKWQEAGYIDPDSLSKTDYNTDFEAGLSASIIGTLDDYVEKMGYEDTLGEDTVGYFVYVDSVRNMEDGAISTNREGNNGLAVPASSTKIEATMRFLNWLFGSQENHDLFQLGIEGVDFVYGEEDGTYEVLTTYSSDFGGYGWTWNPNYALQSASYDDETLTYRLYEYSDDAFVSYPILGFHFDTSDVDLNTYIAQCKAVTDKITTVVLHGIKTDGDGVTYDTITEMHEANTAEAMANGGQETLDALWEQITEFTGQ